MEKRDGQPMKNDRVRTSRRRYYAFVEDYKNLLAVTGEDTAARLAKRFGINITKRKFWDDSLAIIGKHIDRYAEL